MNSLVWRRIVVEERVVSRVTTSVDLSSEEKTGQSKKTRRGKERRAHLREIPLLRRPTAKELRNIHPRPLHLVFPLIQSSFDGEVKSGNDGFDELDFV